jgi:hypothetical protein
MYNLEFILISIAVLTVFVIVYFAVLHIIRRRYDTQERTLLTELL